MTRNFRALVRGAAGYGFASLLASSVHHVYGRTSTAPYGDSTS
jgi:hypothetical protein